MKYWTFDFFRENYSCIYPESRKFWFPLYIMQDRLPGIELHCHEFVEIALVLHGNARHTRCFPGETDKKRNLISAGDIFGLMPGEYHGFSSVKDGWHLVNIIFDPSIFGKDWNALRGLKGLNALLDQRKFLHLSSSCFEDIKDTIFHLQQEIYQRGPMYEQNLKGLLLDLLIRIGRIPVQTENLRTNIYTDKAILFIRRHSSERITLDEIAKFAGASKTYLCYLFQKKMGYSLWDFLNQVRIERAKFYLQSMTNTQISEIAALCGFENKSYFAKIFKRSEGITPREYLEKIRVGKQI